MRATDFLSEAGLKLSDFDSKNNHYWQNLLSLISKNEPLELVDGSTVQLKNPEQTFNALAANWDGSKLATSSQIARLKNVKLTAKDGRMFSLAQIHKSDKIKNKGGVEEIAKFWNLGNVVEGIMGAAVTAKFKNPDKEIDNRDIVKVLKALKAQAVPASANPKKKPLIPYAMQTKAGIDNLRFTMSLNAGDFKALEMSFNDAKSLEEYPGSEEIFKAYDDAANYVNTADTVSTAVSRVVNDKRSNEIIIESEGGSAEKQTSTKADLFITIDKKRERLLSLKSKTVPQIGQVSGHAFENLEEFFKSTVGFGLPASFARDFPQGSFKQVGDTIYTKALPKAYKHIFASLSNTLGGDSTYKEYNFVKQIYDSIIHHATLGEDVIIVYLSPSAKKAYTELKIGPELFEALQEYDLVPRLAGTTTIKVVGIPRTDLAKEISGPGEQEFVQLRSYKQTGSAIRNIVEIKSLLKDLADVNNIKQRKELKVKQPSIPVQQEIPVRQKQQDVAAQKQQSKMTSIKPLGPTDARPAKTPMKAKTKQDPNIVGSQMGLEPQEFAPEE